MFSAIVLILAGLILHQGFTLDSACLYESYIGRGISQIFHCRILFPCCLGLKK